MRLLTADWEILSTLAVAGSGQHDQGFQVLDPGGVSLGPVAAGLAKARSKIRWPRRSPLAANRLGGRSPFAATGRKAGTAPMTLRIQAV